MTLAAEVVPTADALHARSLRLSAQAGSSLRLKSACARDDGLRRNRVSPRLWMRCARDPSLRLKGACAQDDASPGEKACAQDDAHFPECSCIEDCERITGRCRRCGSRRSLLGLDRRCRLGAGSLSAALRLLLSHPPIATAWCGTDCSRG